MVVAEVSMNPAKASQAVTRMSMIIINNNHTGHKFAFSSFTNLIHHLLHCNYIPMSVKVGSPVFFASACATNISSMKSYFSA